MQLDPYSQDTIELTPAPLQSNSVTTTIQKEGTLLTDRVTDDRVAFYTTEQIQLW